jgi:hypothetical protein
MVAKMTPDSSKPASASSSGEPSQRFAAISGCTRVFEERHYTLQEIAILWNISIDTVRRIFEREQGVLIIGESNPKGKRRYRTLRIPASVVARVHKKCSLYL